MDEFINEGSFQEYKYNQEITECEWKQIYNRSDKKLITPINGIHNSFSPNVTKGGLNEEKTHLMNLKFQFLIRWL